MYVSSAENLGDIIRSIFFEVRQPLLAGACALDYIIKFIALNGKIVRINVVDSI